MAAARGAGGRFISQTAAITSDVNGRLRDSSGKFVKVGAGGAATSSGLVQIGNVDVRLFSAQLSELLRSGQGHVYRHMIIQAELVKIEAQRLVGVYKGDTSRRQRKPGTLRDSIVKRAGILNGDIVFYVGSPDKIAMIHHEGTEPHIIRAVNKPKLVFYWPKVGKVVAFTEVHHPGTKPNRYLIDALKVLH